MSGKVAYDGNLKAENQKSVINDPVEREHWLRGCNIPGRTGPGKRYAVVFTAVPVAACAVEACAALLKRFKTISSLLFAFRLSVISGF
jgi:hypothetical protein